MHKHVCMSHICTCVGDYISFPFISQPLPHSIFLDPTTLDLSFHLTPCPFRWQTRLREEMTKHCTTWPEWWWNNLSMMTQFCRGRSYLTVYLSEWSPSLTSLDGLPGAGLVTQRSVQDVCLCVCECVGVLVCNHGRVCVRMCVLVCVLSAMRVFRILCVCEVC